MGFVLLMAAAVGGALYYYWRLRKKKRQARERDMGVRMRARGPHDYYGDLHGMEEGRIILDPGRLSQWLRSSVRRPRGLGYTGLGAARPPPTREVVDDGEELFEVRPKSATVVP